MKISKELIEKYHSGTCSAEEAAVVENWLFGDESDEELLLPENDKLEHREEMWAEIASILPNRGRQIKVDKLNNRFVWRAVAAVFALAVLGSCVYFSRKPTDIEGVIVMNNASETNNKNLDETEYTISIGPKSNVEINNQTGIIDFCGAVMINPKKDIEFVIQGACSKKEDKQERMILKKGLNYIALNYSSHSNPSEVIVVEEGSMMGLPPLLMKQLLYQFNI